VEAGDRYVEGLDDPLDAPRLRAHAGLRVQVEVFNILNLPVCDLDDYDASRLAGEPGAGVDDLHFHPTKPRSARLAMVFGF
jgi:hypothetical protein